MSNSTDLPTGSLGKALGGFLDQLLAEGFTLPFRVAAIPRQGTMFLGEYRQQPAGVECTILAEHEAGVMVLPINFVVVDSTGAAARVVIEPSGELTGTVLQ